MAVSKDTGSTVDIGFNKEEQSRIQMALSAILGPALQAEYERGRKDERAFCLGIATNIVNRSLQDQKCMSLPTNKHYYQGRADGATEVADFLKWAPKDDGK